MNIFRTIRGSGIDSSFISWAGWGTLERANLTGATYSDGIAVTMANGETFFYNATERQYDAMLLAESAGRYFNNNLRGGTGTFVSEVTDYPATLAAVRAQVDTPAVAPDVAANVMMRVNHEEARTLMSLLDEYDLQHTLLKLDLLNA